MNADNGQPSATCPALDRYSQWQLSCEGCKKRWQAFQWVEPMAEGPRCEANFLSEFMRRPPSLDQHQLISHPFNLDSTANAIRDGFSHCNSLKCFRMPKHQVDRGLTIHVNLLIASGEGTAILTRKKQSSSEYHRMAEPTHDPLAYAHAHWRADGCRSLSSCSNAPDFFPLPQPIKASIVTSWYKHVTLSCVLMNVEQTSLSRQGWNGRSNKQMPTEFKIHICWSPPFLLLFAHFVQGFVLLLFRREAMRLFCSHTRNNCQRICLVHVCPSYYLRPWDRINAKNQRCD